MGGRGRGGIAHRRFKSTMGLGTYFNVLERSRVDESEREQERERERDCTLYAMWPVVC